MAKRPLLRHLVAGDTPSGVHRAAPARHHPVQKNRPTRLPAHEGHMKPSTSLRLSAISLRHGPSPCPPLANCRGHLGPGPSRRV